MFRKITLFIAGILAVTGASAQCPTITCPANITVVKDPNTCSKTVTYTAPAGVDPCYSTAVNVNFAYTGSVQTWTVPAGVTSVSVDVKGAGGGNSVTTSGPMTNHTPGQGGRTQATLAVTPGQVLNIYVGQKGANGNVSANSVGGWNGGGNGSYYSPYYGGGAGGGASDIRVGGTALTNRVVVAGGGGGAAYNYSSGDYGGNGGGLTGVAGASNNNNTSGYGGGGGTQNSGGAGGTYTSPTGSPGTLGVGGAGSTSQCTGGGGGGGYYGGGGGGWTGGGGGSGYANTTLCTNVVHSAGGGNTTNGAVTISYVPAPTTVQTTGLPSGSSFPVGTTTNTFVTTGGNNVTATCSFTVTVTDPQQPVFTTQPEPNVPICIGGNMTLTGTATNANSYQWYRNGVAVANNSNTTGAQTNTLTITNLNGAQFGDYVLRATGPCVTTPSDTVHVTQSGNAAITTQPSGGQNICVGNAFMLNVAATDASGYQWYRNGTPLTNGGDVSGATSNMLNIINADAGDIGSYTVVALGNSGCNSITSNGANVNVNPAVAVTSVPPSSITMCSGSPLQIDVIANNANGYQWYKNNNPLTNGGDISGANTANLVVNNVDNTDAGTYHVVVLAQSGCVNSSVPSTAVAINNTPNIVTQPQATQNVCAGTTMIANVVAQNGTSYQWYKNNVPLSNGGNVSGATTNVLTVTNTTATDNGNYTVQVGPQTGCPPLMSNASAVTINPNASVITQPVPTVTVCEGNAVLLNVTAGAAGSYQWYKNGNALTNGLGVSGATTPNLRVENTNFMSNGAYNVMMTAYYNGCAGVTSASSQVTINPLSTTLAATNTQENSFHVDGIGHIYTSGNCEPIVKVEDPTGGNTLGNVHARATIDGSVQLYVNQPYVQRHVDVEPGSNGLATVTLYATQAEFDSYNAWVQTNVGVNAPQMPTGGVYNGNIKVYQFHGTGTIPGNYTGSLDILTPVSVLWNGNYWEVKVMVGGFSGFYLYTDISLPVRLAGVSAHNSGNVNIVSWNTASEEKGQVFNIERSTDGRTFTQVGAVKSKGSASNYSFTDEKAVTGINYYRVQVMELDGQSTYSNVVSATVEKGGALDMQAYPNPTSDNVTVKLSEEAGANASLEVLDYTGKVLKTQSVIGNSTVVEMGNLPAGMYILKYVDGANRSTIKINKQ